MKRAVLLTGHYWNSRRKAGFHGIADSLVRKGWEVLFFTVPISRLSIIRRDYRMEYPVRREAGKVISFGDSIKSYIWFTLWHPVNLRAGLLNRMSYKFFKRYGELPLGDSEEYFRKADLFIFESSPGLLLYDRLNKLNSTARKVYRVSDDLRLLRNHPVVLDTEEHLAPKFDLVSVPSDYIFQRFDGLKNLRLQYHGIRKDLYSKDVPSPYKNIGKVNIVFVGQDRFDYDFIERASAMSSDWHFHIIGPIRKLPSRSNIFSYGEIPFEETIPYVIHADIGLHTLVYSFGAESFTDSLKVIQYSYCRLPIMAPEFLKSSRKHAFYYKPGDANSIRTAITNAIDYDHSQITTDDILSWDDLTQKLVGEEQ